MIVVALATLWAFALPSEAAEVRSPRGEAVAYDANPSQTGAASEDAVFGPMEVAWKRSFAGPVNQPLVANGRLFVNVAKSNGGGSYGSTVRALNPQTGRQLWSANHDHVYFAARMAVNSGVVVALGPTYGEPLRAFDAQTGEKLWQYFPADDFWSGAVVADGGVAYISQGASTVGYGRIVAFRISDGLHLWTSPNVVVDGDDRAGIALDDDSIYLADVCGGAAAVSRISGAIRWTHGSGGSGGCFGHDAVVAGGVLYAGGGEAYVAETGQPAPDVLASPQAIHGTVGIGYDPEINATRISAFPLSGGQALWTHPLGPTNSAIEPLVTGGTVYTARNYYDSFSEIVGYGARSGVQLMRERLPHPGTVSVGGTKPGLTAAAKHLYVAQGLQLVALRPLLSPPATGLDLLVRPSDALVRTRVRLFAGLGRDVREPGQSVTFTADRFPFGRPRDATQRATTLDDGVARARFRSIKNTRFRATSSHGSSSATAYAYPTTRLRLTRVRRRVVEARTIVGRLPKRVAQGRRVFAYYGYDGRRFIRRSAGRLEVRGSRAVARSRVRLPERIGRRDVVAVCVHRLAQDGYGRAVGLYGRCGQREVLLRDTPTRARAGSRPLDPAIDRERAVMRPVSR